MSEHLYILFLEPYLLSKVWSKSEPSPSNFPNKQSANKKKWLVYICMYCTHNYEEKPWEISFLIKVFLGLKLNLKREDPKLASSSINLLLIIWYTRIPRKKEKTKTFSWRVSQIVAMVILFLMLNISYSGLVFDHFSNTNINK